MEWSDVYMRMLLKEYGSMIISIIGVLMFFAVLLYTINFFDKFSTEFIASLTGSQI